MFLVLCVNKPKPKSFAMVETVNVKRDVSDANEDTVATLLDRALCRVECSKCSNCLEGTASMTAEQVCRSYVVRGSPLEKAACCYFEHSTSVGAIVQYLKTQLKGMTEGSLIRDVNTYMSTKGAFRLGTSDGPKPFKVTLYGLGQTTRLGKPMSVDRFGQPKADSAGAPHHYHVYMGWTLAPPPPLQSTPPPSLQKNESNDDNKIQMVNIATSEPTSYDDRCGTGDNPRKRKKPSSPTPDPVAPPLVHRG